MKSKVIFKNKMKLENIEIFKENLEKEIDKYLNEGYKIISSNMANDNVYMYIYVLLIKE